MDHSKSLEKPSPSSVDALVSLCQSGQLAGAEAGALDLDAYPTSDKGRGGRGSSCRRCSNKKNRGRRSGYIPTGPRYEENEARSRDRDPVAWREAKRKADRKHTAKKRAATPPVAKPTLSPSELRSNSRASKRRTFQKRKALGMSGRQANYMAPAPEFDKPWNAIKR